MTLVSLTHCSHLLALDPKTLRRWMSLSGICAQPHPADARLKCLTPQQVQQLAQAHRRTLADEVQPAISAPTTANRVLSPPVGSDVAPDALVSSSLTKQLGSLQAHVATLEQQLTLLTDQLQQEQQWRRSQASQASAQSQRSSREKSQGSSKEKSPRLSKEKSQGSSRETSLEPAEEKSQGSSKQSARAMAHSASLERGKRSPVSPLVEYGTGGQYVVICPKQGLLAFVPDSAEWFAWLSPLRSFRFIGQHGHLTVCRGACLPTRGWRASRRIRNRTYNLSLGRTDSLTIAELERAAAALQAHLN